MRKYRITYYGSGNSEIVSYSKVPALSIYADYYDLFIDIYKQTAITSIVFGNNVLYECWEDNFYVCRT